MSARARLDTAWHNEKDSIKALRDLGVTYLGAGEWDLPDGAQMFQSDARRWVLVLDDVDYYVIVDEL